MSNASQALGRLELRRRPETKSEGLIRFQLEGGQVIEIIPLSRFAKITYKARLSTVVASVKSSPGEMSKLAEVIYDIFIKNCPEAIDPLFSSIGNEKFKLILFGILSKLKIDIRVFRGIHLGSFVKAVSQKLTENASGSSQGILAGGDIDVLNKVIESGGGSLEKAFELIKYLLRNHREDLSRILDSPAFRRENAWQGTISLSLSNILNSTAVDNEAFKVSDWANELVLGEFIILIKNFRDQILDQNVLVVDIEQMISLEYGALALERSEER